MSARPDELVALRGLLEDVRRRLAVRDVLRVSATAALTGAALLAAGAYFRASLTTRTATAVTFAIVAALFAARPARARTTRGAAHEIERHSGALRNLLVTGEELLAAPDRTPAYMRQRVLREAAVASVGIDPRGVVPLGREIAATGVAVVLLASAWLMPSAGARVNQVSAATTGRTAPAAPLEIDIAPPSYTGRPRRQLLNPASLDVLAGSTATIRVAGAPSLAVRVNGTTLPVAGHGDVQATLTESGFVAVDGGAVHALLPLTVTPDAAPDVRVTAPGRDLRVTDARVSIPIRAAATDDIGLRAFDLRYTIISGGGEQFTFSEGTLPATLVKDSERAWKAEASLSLAALKLEPGDALVYRAVAADARPGGAGEASSDTFFVEIARPGDEALEGIDMPPDKERYALSEAMVVVKIQRLIAHEASMRRGEIEEAAGAIAAEQRAVRANFIFMLGGEVEDEVVEAETSHEIQEGRLANQARKDIVAATVLMAKVEQALAAVSTRTALPLAQEAVRTLQRAFGHSRYLLRALPARIRIDPSRRLAGDLTTVRDWRRDLLAPAADPGVASARDALGDLLAIARAPKAPDAGSLTRIAERVLAIEPGAAEVQTASRSIVAARDAFADGDVDRGRQAIAAAAGSLLPIAQRGRIDAPAVAGDAARVAGAAAPAGGGPR
jgi:hypothetical protein